MKISTFVARTMVGVGITAAVVLTAPAPASADVTPMKKLSHSAAAAKFKDAGISWSSSGGCSDRNQSNCTSFDQMNSNTVLGTIEFKKASGCDLRVTGGSETGHADGTYSHWNGYKIDLAMTKCQTNYITDHFASIGGSKWESSSGNVYYNESNHWDVTFHNCGGC